VSRVRNTPASPNSQGIWFGNSEHSLDRWNSHAQQARLNLFFVELLVQPIWISCWIPSFQCSGLTPLAICAACLRYGIVSSQSDRVSLSTIDCRLLSSLCDAPEVRFRRCRTMKPRWLPKSFVFNTTALCPAIEGFV